MRLVAYLTVTLMLSLTGVGQPTFADEDKSVPLNCDNEEVWPHPVPLKRVSPSYPSRAINRGVEGWVEMTYSISEDGTTQDIEVKSSYPPGMFEKSAIRSVSKWIYPRGSSVIQTTTTITFAIEKNRSIRSSTSKLIENARKLIQSQTDLDKAAELLSEARAKKSLTLVEMMLIEQTYGLHAFVRQDLSSVVTHLRQASRLEIGKPNSLTDVTSEILLYALINSGQFCEAVNVFDGWNPAGDETIKDKFVHRIATIRSALKDGRQIEMN